MKNKDFSSSQGEQMSGIVTYILKRSKIRRMVMKYLLEVDNIAKTIPDIAYNINSNNCDVLGAIKGKRGRYGHDFSLLNLNLVEEFCDEKDRCVKLYRLSQEGMQTIQTYLNKK